MRTKGSGWGAGTILYQVCILCGRKKAYYNPIGMCKPFDCTWCKERFDSKELLRYTYVSQRDRMVKNE